MTDKLVYERWDETTRRLTELTLDEDTGLPIIRHTQDTKPIIDNNKRLRSNFDPLVKRDVTHVASIPLVVYADLVRKGVTKDPVRFNKWLDSYECRAFRVDDGRKL